MAQKAFRARKEAEMQSLAEQAAESARLSARNAELEGEVARLLQSHQQHVPGDADALSRLAESHSRMQCTRLLMCRRRFL